MPGRLGRGRTADHGPGIKSPTPGWRFGCAVLGIAQAGPWARRRRRRSRSLSSRAISRSAARCARACRLSKDRRPRARAISTFAQPSWKYSDRGTSVMPASRGSRVARPGWIGEWIPVGGRDGRRPPPRPVARQSTMDHRPVPGPASPCRPPRSARGPSADGASGGPHAPAPTRRRGRTPGWPDIYLVRTFGECLSDRRPPR
jgi:hypothetical protein